MMKNNIIIGIAIAITLLLASGYSVHKYNEFEPEPTHKCIESKLIKYCSRLSESGITCFPNIENTKGYKRCYPTWEKILSVESEYPSVECKLGYECINGIKVRK